MSHRPLRVAVLISGTGSNLKALIDAARSGRLNIEISQVISNRSEAPGLGHAREAGIETEVIGASDRAGRDRAVAQCLDDKEVELVVLAGYMSILGARLVARYTGRIINLHPSLLPLYPGLDTYRRALAAGDREHGASIHFVTPELDSGPIISQVRIPVLPGDTARELAARLGPREHHLLRATVELFTERRVKMHSTAVVLDGQRITQPLLLDEQNRFD